eukprot:TRINITY_DN16365_c0_g1_i2.p1 TRINITY_DN16365_c0_g1~~TRINITY_DN16365_c0_g1_i2.p1  ORF type:complete len:374 (+),score=92.62 TRINITY_DN16365_c0_g1_i2:284-1405(+)
MDELEKLTCKRALQAFDLEEKEWGVNVQPYSGSIANLAALIAILRPHDRVMGLDVSSGGHSSHGYYLGSKKIAASSIFFESLPYKISPETGLVDYAELEKNAKLFQPKVIICGGSAHPRDWDYATVRRIADEVGAMMFVDMAHYSALVAAKVVSSPFLFADIVTTTTQKSLRGPHGALIFFNKNHPADLEAKVNRAVYPSLQGGPHNNTIAGICVQLREVATPEFHEYAHQVVRNAKALAASLLSKGFQLVTGGTDTHLLVCDLRQLGLTGHQVEAICDSISISLTSCSLRDDQVTSIPNGVRIGTLAMTSRGLKESDFEVVAEFLHRAVQLALEVQKVSAEDFAKVIDDFKAVSALRTEVEEFAMKFDIPGM